MCVLIFISDMNLSKLVDEDEPLFMSLIEDMFPGIKLTTKMYKELQKAIANATTALGIMNHSEWNLKTIQVHNRIELYIKSILITTFKNNYEFCSYTRHRSFAMV